ncbi:MAG: lysophospholipase [Anaerolineales bacterium]|jgi:alpha-beta hydrolase superfamily lysophospholipase
MNEPETFFETKDHQNLFFRVWQPAGHLKAAVCLVHGLGEHSGRYQHVAAAFNAAGVGVWGFDLRGHGKTPGKRGQVPHYDVMLDDIADAIDAAQEQFTGVPVFLYGHSMGGNLVLNYALRRKPALAGVIATSPWIQLAFSPPDSQVRLARLMNHLLPNLTQPNGLDVQALAHDPEVVAAYQNDPLVHDRVSIRLSVEFLDAGEWALEHAAELALPLLLVHGSADPITSAAASQEFAARAGELCTLKIWEGLYHETHNEPQKEQVIAYNLEWLEQHLG